MKIAFDWKSMALQAIGVSCPQKHGDQLRVTMSRVHRDREDPFTHNWTWSCQGLGSTRVPKMYRYVHFAETVVGTAVDEFVVK